MGNTAVDPDLQIRRVGGEGRKGRTQSQKKLFRPFGPQFGLKIRGGGRPPGPLPWIRHWNMLSLISSETVDWQLSCLVMGEHLKKMAIH